MLGHHRLKTPGAHRGERAGAPGAVVLALGDGPCEAGVGRRMVLGLHRQPLHPGRGGLAVERRPGHEHRPVRRTRIRGPRARVLHLDDEGTTVDLRDRRVARARLGSLRGAAPHPVGGPAVLRAGTRSGRRSGVDGGTSSGLPVGGSKCRSPVRAAGAGSRTWATNRADRGAVGRCARWTGPPLAVGGHSSRGAQRDGPLPRRPGPGCRAGRRRALTRTRGHSVGGGDGSGWTTGLSRQNGESDGEGGGRVRAPWGCFDEDPVLEVMMKGEPPVRSVAAGEGLA